MNVLFMKGEEIKKTQVLRDLTLLCSFDLHCVIHILLMMIRILTTKISSKSTTNFKIGPLTQIFLVIQELKMVKLLYIRVHGIIIWCAWCYI